MTSKISQDKQISAYRRAQRRDWRRAGNQASSASAEGNRAAPSASASQGPQVTGAASAIDSGPGVPSGTVHDAQLSAYRRAQQNAWSRGMDPRSATVSADPAGAVPMLATEAQMPPSIEALARPYDANLQHLPDDVLNVVLGHLDYVSAVHVASTCKSLHAATRDVLTAGIPKFYAGFLRTSIDLHHDLLPMGRDTIARNAYCAVDLAPEAIKGLKKSAVDKDKFFPVAGYHAWAAGMSESLWGKDSDNLGGMAATYVGSWLMMPVLEPLRLAVHAGVAAKRMRKADKIASELKRFYPEEAFRKIESRVTYLQRDRRETLAMLPYADVATAMVHDPASLIPQLPHPDTSAQAFAALDAKQQAEHKYSFPGGLNHVLWSPDARLSLTGHPYTGDEVHGMQFKKKSRF